MVARTRAVLFGLVGAVLVVALVAVVAVAWRAMPSRGSAPPGGSDLAVVMLGGEDRLVTVDLSALRVVSDVRLRSMPTDLSIDTSTGLAVTAQAGGIAEDADDVVGVYDVRAGGPVDYVELGCPNPGLVTAGGGVAYVGHGMLRSGGMVLSVVDLRRRTVAREGLMPEGPGVPLGFDGTELWTLEMDPASIEGTTADGPAALFVTALDRTTLARRRLGGSRTDVNQVLPAGGGRLLLLSGRPGSGPATVTEIDASTGTAGRSVTIDSLEHGAIRGCLAGRWLAVSEWDGGDPGDEGTWIAWLDRDLLSAPRRLRIAGGPCAIAAWGEQLVVIERGTSKLLVIDTSTARVTGSVDLGGRPPLVADVEVLPAG
ncbi:MAG: hypothetical protein Q7W16_00880 [Coriobacteriia bacterium]|nr:hypothetical protein [Coriobacteriia bacterium]